MQSQYQNPLTGQRAPGSSAQATSVYKAAKADQMRGYTIPPWLRIAIGAVLIGVWSAVLAGVPQMLPIQASSWLTFLALVITPGYLLGDLFMRHVRLDYVERLAIAFPLGVAVLGIPGMVTLLRHGTINDLALGWTAVSAALIAIWIGCMLWDLRKNVTGVKNDKWSVPELLTLLFVAALFLIGTPALTLYKLDGDAYAVGSFAADALAGLPLNGSEPLFGTDLGPGVRMDFNQSLPLSYLWSYLSGIDALVLAAQASRIMVALWAVLASYTLGKAAGMLHGNEHRGRRLGLLTAGIQLAIYLANPFLRGDSVSWFFFERTTADKFMVPVVMLPIVFAFTIRYVRSGSLRFWWIAAISTLAVSAIHPLIAAMLALALTAFGGFHLLFKLRDRRTWLRVGFVAVLVVLAMVLPMIQLVMSRGDAPLAESYPNTFNGWPISYKYVPALPFINVPTLDTYGPLPDLSQVQAIEADTDANPLLIWRYSVNMNRRRLIVFSLNNYISDPNIILEPAYLLALLIVPFLFFGIRRNIGAQFAVSTTLAVLFVMFNPWLTPFIGSLVMPWILWRFVWLIPYALLIAMGVDKLLLLLVQTYRRMLIWKPRNRSKPAVQSLQYGALAVLAMVTLFVSPSMMQNLSALEERAGYPYYYPTPADLLGKLDEMTTTIGSATVLADQDLSVVIPAYAANANIVAHRVPTTSEIFPADQQQIALQRLIDQDTFFRSRYLTDSAVDILNKYDVGYIIASSASDLDIQLRLAPEWFKWIIDDQSYSLYQVVQPPTKPDSIAANSALAERRWDDASLLYNRALKANPNNLLAYAGLAEIAQSQGKFATAIDYYEKILLRENLPVVSYRLGNIYRDLGQLDRAMAEYYSAQQTAPQIARLHTAMGDVCLSAGRDNCAEEQYLAAVVNQNLPDEAARLVAQADMWRQRGRVDHAIDYYEQAVDLQSSEANQLMLVSAYQEVKRFDEAEALLNLMRLQRPLSTEVLRMSADVKSAQGQYGEAVRHLERAITIQEFTGQESSEMRLLLAQTLTTANRYDDALEQVQIVQKLHPSSATAYGLLGDIYGQLGMAEEATDAYMHAFRLDPTQVQLYLALTNQFRQQGGRQDDVLELLQTAIRANPDEAALTLALGDHLEQSGETEAAIEAYQSALDKFERNLSPASASSRSKNTGRAFAFVRMASVSEDRGLLEPAMNYYSAAVAAAPDAPWTYAAYADALRRRGDNQGAVAAYEQSIDNDPDYANAYIRLADLYEAQGDAATAAILLDQALNVTLDNTNAVLKSKGFAGLGKVTPASDSNELSFDSDAVDNSISPTANEAIAERIIAELLQSSDMVFESNEGASLLSMLTQLAKPENNHSDIALLYQKAIDAGEQAGFYPVDLARYYKGLADLYLLQEQPILAAEAYRTASTLDNWWPQARMGLARALEEVGQNEEALAQLRSAVQIAPGYVEAQIALADALAERAMNREADAIYADIAESHPGNARATTALARAQEANHQWTEAEASYRQTLKLNPGNAEAYVDLAALLLTQARYEEAQPLLDKALELDGENVNAYIQYAVLEQRLGNRLDAVDWFRKAGALQPENDTVALVMIDLLQRYAYFDMALTYVQDGLASNPQNVELLVRQAQLQRLSGQSGLALTTLLNAAQLNLSDARLSAELGEYYVQQGRPDAALSAYRQAVKAGPSETEYYLRTAELFSNQGDFTQVEHLLRGGIERAEHPALLTVALADMYLQQGDNSQVKAVLEEGIDTLGEDPALVVAMGAYLDADVQPSGNAQQNAETWFTDYLTRYPDVAVIHRALADHYMRYERIDDAIEQYEIAMELEPGNASLLVGVGTGFEAAERFDDAAAVYQRAIRLEPAEPDGYLALGNLYSEQARWDDAKSVYNDALVILPNNGRLLVAYADFWANQGDVQESLATLDSAIDKSPSTDTLVRRAVVYRKLNRNEEAQMDLELALEKEPGLLSAMLALGDLYQEQGNAKNARDTFDNATELRPGVTTANGELPTRDRPASLSGHRTIGGTRSD